MQTQSKAVPSNTLKQIDIVKIYSDKSCLIIDDFPEIRGSLSRTLINFGAKSVDTAADAEEAVHLCSTQKFDVVLCDYNLGAGKDGQQLLEEIRYLRTFLITSLFIMVTGESSKEMVLGALEYQPDDYITKPFTQASLRLRLDKAIVRHQFLLPVKHLIAKSEYQLALNRCNELMAQESRYVYDCLKLKAQLHFMLEQYSESQDIYLSVTNRKPLVWARLGLAKSLCELGQFENAKHILKDIIKEDERYVEAHDILAYLHTRQKDSFQAQSATENATLISPKSILRHRRLAQLADQNSDDETALKSHQMAIKWGANSCHESAQDYFNYARKVSDTITSPDQTTSHSLAQQAKRILDRARKRYSDNSDIVVQASFVEAQLESSLINPQKANNFLANGTKAYNELLTPDIDTSLEYARALYSLGEKDQAIKLLKKLAAQHANDRETLTKIDALTGEPITENGKNMAATLTKTGISLYEDKNFPEAIKTFSDALIIYPKHIGLHLNLMQVICAQTSQEGSTETRQKLCSRSLRAIGSLTAKHQQFKRYEFIRKQIKHHFPDLLIT